MPPTAPPARLHVVLVPGFAGFDALGQLEYYAGVTALFGEWRARVGGPPAALHYFDNLPTASVATRAGRLGSWLAKRLARGEFAAGDEVALVGHSTGGLDIRQLLLDLDERARAEGTLIPVDGDSELVVRLRPSELLGLVRRVAFLSVPQRGTNIADWVRRHPLPRKLAIADLRALAGLATLSPLNDLQERAARLVARASGADLFRAVRDAVSEVDAGAAGGDPARVADAQEAAADLQLWLAHVAADFGAIDDLSSERLPGSRSPAHRTEGERAAELELWARRGIGSRSWATLGARPYDFAAGEEVAPWSLARPGTSPWARLREGARARTDDVYLCGYRACAGGPFRGPAAGARVGGGPGRDPRTIEDWDSDGIVNTASMLWPHGEETRLVEADHGDVIGHYRLVEASGGGPREFHTYDLLRSGSPFGEADFRALWGEVLDFSAGRLD